MHGAGMKRVEQKVAQRTTFDLRTFPRTGHPADMIVKNRPIGIGEAKAIEIRSMIGPERFHQASGFRAVGHGRQLVPRREDAHDHHAVRGEVDFRKRLDPPSGAANGIK